MLRRVTSTATASRTASSLLRRSNPSMAIGGNTRAKHPSSRAFAAATSAEKRALNAQQLKGSSGKSSSTAAKESATGAAPTAESGGGGIGPVLALLVATGGAGAAYYNGLLDDFLGADSSPLPQKLEDVKKPKKKKKAAEATDSPTPITNIEKKNANAAAAADESLSTKELLEVNEIIADVIGEVNEEVAAVTEAIESIAKENEAALASVVATPVDITAKIEERPPVPAEAVPKEVKKKTPEPEPVPEPQPEPEPAPVLMAYSTPASTLDEAKIMSEIAELKKALHEKSDKALTEAHSELAKISSMDVMSLDLDQMTSSQLKVRLVQMAKDLEERTKWEAVRLQEFLSMKEKEVEDRYVLLIKKLRIEAEHLQEEKLSEQRKALVAQAEEALKEQQARSEAFLENSMQIEAKAHAEDKAAFEQKTDEAMSAKYEELYGKELAKIKDDFATKMNQRVQQMERLTKKLSDLETSLKDSQDFQVGSLEAHRITAAAIALMEKLESGEPAGAAVNALEAVASENAVVSAAVKSLPNSVTRSGIMTVQELQAGFEENIYPQCRRAANIPEGQDGLEGQLLGSIFATLRPAPGPEDVAPESEKNSSEYVLARIRRYVRLGDLEKAIGETKKLSGQVAYTAKDWNSHARDRVAVEKALKVIRMECALANDNLSKAAA